MALLGLTFLTCTSVSGTVEAEKLYASGMIYPSPPHYEKGLEELTFLGELEDGNWRTVSLSNGIINGEKAKMKSCLKAVRSWPGLKEWEDRAVQPRAEVAWILELATNPQTHWDGVCELMPQDRKNGSLDWPFRGMNLDEEQRVN